MVVMMIPYRMIMLSLSASRPQNPLRQVGSNPRTRRRKPRGGGKLGVAS
jgi:hypothetical protein